MRRLKAAFGPNATNDRHVWRIVDADLLASQWQPDLQFLIPALTPSQRDLVAHYRASGLSNVEWVDAIGLQSGDIVSATPERCEASILYRESDLHHGLQMTNRCNSYCLMCSQPPHPARRLVDGSGSD